ncbi:MAG TPA: hypothetical protein VFH54_09690 [Mycobacteriales bacterium]|nr:hypothetical protein [Mycobacteriales bacterium]
MRTGETRRDLVPTRRSIARVVFSLLCLVSLAPPLVAGYRWSHPHYGVLQSHRASTQRGFGIAELVLCAAALVLTALTVVDRRARRWHVVAVLGLALILSGYGLAALDAGSFASICSCGNG